MAGELLTVITTRLSHPAFLFFLLLLLSWDKLFMLVVTVTLPSGITWYRTRRGLGVLHVHKEKGGVGGTRDRRTNQGLSYGASECNVQDCEARG